MSEAQKKYRFAFSPAFTLASRPVAGSKEELMSNNNLNYDRLKPLLDDVEWDIHEGVIAPYGDWPVENREEFCLAAAARLPIIRKMCESGKYNAIILMGGGEPGFFETREIARKFNIPAVSCGFAQMHIATMLGNKFSIIDLAESHNMYYYNVVVQHGFAQRCASIKSINISLPRPPYNNETSLKEEREKAERGEKSEAVERAVAASVEAIEEDGAEVITFGCSATFWLQPFLQQRLDELGWEIPVLDAFACTIVLAKAMVDMGVTASGLMFPGDRPKKWRRKKVF
ncbi:aspartate/glutamate racemase family protein [Chloroflexota bacterium]